MLLHKIIRYQIRQLRNNLQKEMYFLFKTILNVLPIFSEQSSILRMLGGKIAETAKIKGRLDISNPRQIELKDNSRISNISLKPGKFLLVDRKTNIQNSAIKSSTIASGPRRFQGKKIGNEYITLSIDLESDIATRNSSSSIKKKQFSHNTSRKTALRLIHLLNKWKIPCTWAICGSLFTEMPDVVSVIAKNKLFEIAYHSLNHMNYNLIQKERMAADFNDARAIRKRWNLPLSSWVYPYNEIAEVNSVVAAGFKNIRGYVCNGYVTGIYDFDKFKLFCTSDFVCPNTVNFLTYLLARKTSVNNFNFFTHEFNWNTDEDFRLFEKFIKALKKSSYSIIKLGDHI